MRAIGKFVFSHLSIPEVQKRGTFLKCQIFTKLRRNLYNALRKIELPLLKEKTLKQDLKTFFNRYSFGHDSLITLGNEVSEFARRLDISSHFRLKNVCKHAIQINSAIILILQYRY